MMNHPKFLDPYYLPLNRLSKMQYSHSIAVKHISMELLPG